MEVEASGSSGNVIAAMQAGSAVYAKQSEAANAEYILHEQAGELVKNMVDMALARQKNLMVF